MIDLFQSVEVKGKKLSYDQASGHRPAFVAIGRHTADIMGKLLEVWSPSAGIDFYIRSIDGLAPVKCECESSPECQMHCFPGPKRLRLHARRDLGFGIPSSASSLPGFTSTYTIPVQRAPDFLAASYGALTPPGSFKPSELSQQMGVVVPARKKPKFLEWLGPEDSEKSFSVKGNAAKVRS
jgi:hypothetical protein